MTKKSLNLTNNSLSKRLRKKDSKKDINEIKNGTTIHEQYSEKSPKGDVLNPEFTQTAEKPPVNKNNIPYIQLFRYSTKWERFLVILGLFFASIAAFGLPFAVVMYGEFTTLLVDRAVMVGRSTPTVFLSWFGGGKILINATVEENRAALMQDAEAFGLGSAIGALLQFITAAIGVDLINYTALKQIQRIRTLFLEAVLRQDMSWYDTVTENNFASKVTENLDKLKEGIGEKLAIFIYLVMSFIICIVFSFFYGWKLTLVVISCAPFIAGTTALVAKIQSSLTRKELISYSSAGAVAEEVLSSIRTVIAFGGQEKEVERYRVRLGPAEMNGEKKGIFSGIGGGIMWFIIYCCYGLAFWYGVQLILDDRHKFDKEYTPAVLIIVLFGVLAGAQNMGLTSPHMEAFGTARGAAHSVFSIIDRQPLIDTMSNNGLKPEKMEGNIEFENVYFRYPARKDVQVLSGINLTVNAGQSVALVGPSGCGKSTCVQLLQRLYDPIEGSVKVDGAKVSELNTAWLRSHIGLVGQEPVLFSVSIGENIKYGNPSVTQAEIEKAAKIANCHDFITKLPDGYDTPVGERGAQLSGGQKQRIAIARALVRNPRILLLDEATSALDPTSEKKVQDALEKASQGRTTLVVSHRLSTITNMDKIVFIRNGIVEEEGTHAELMKKQGLYFDLVNATNSNDDDDDETTPRKMRNQSYRSSFSVNESSVKSDGESSEDFVVEERQPEEKYQVSMIRLMKMNSPEWKFILFGSFAAFAHGSSLPAFAVVFGEFYGILANPNAEEVSSESNLFSAFFVVIGIVAGLGYFFQTYMFNIAGVRLTTRLRQMAFKTIISQEMGWFDESKNSVGALCARLAGDCANVQGATGTRVGSMMQSSATLIVGVVMSFFFSWNLTLVAIVTIPLVLGSVFFEARYMESSGLQEKVAIEGASKLAVEAIMNIRTVASLGQEPHVLERYCEKIELATIASRKKTRLRGMVFSMGQAAPFFGYALAMYYGGTLVANDGLPYKTVIMVSEALIFGSWMLGQALAYAPNVSAAMLSAGRLLNLLDRVPKIQDPPIPFDDEGKTEGRVTYQNVEFTYPTRPETTVLQGFNLDIQKGNTIALVGPSGCGKSTCVQLLLRYYDADSGRINLDGTPTTDYTMDKLRSHLGLVSQEPVLFDRTIAENIAYGDNFREVPMQEIIESAKKSNIHEFIVNLPLGYETPLGAKGTQLSGGQKQRIAIARALVRNPQILLLDEATSALDTHSEKIVQAALDSARAGRTCITIAHRLTTVQNADQICVIQQGDIVEKGTHQQLMALNQIYAKLYIMQQVS